MDAFGLLRGLVGLGLVLLLGCRAPQEPGGTLGAIPRAASVTKHSLVIALDGTRADTLLSGHNAAINALVSQTWAPGYRTAWSRSAQTSYGADTWSGPNHGALMTGATAGTLGITDNGNVASAKWSLYPPYLKRLEAAKPSANTAYLVTWSTDYTAIPFGADFGSLGTDEGNTGIAEGILAGTYSGTATNGASWPLGRVPHAVFVFLDDPDHAGHAWGFDPSTAYVNEVQRADLRIGRLLAAVKGRPNFANEDWQIIITSDHGGLINTDHHVGTNPSGSYYDANQTTVPFLVVSRTVGAGELLGTPRNYDAATTALSHLGVSYPTSGSNALQGVVVGGTVAGTAPHLTTDQVAYLPFDGALGDLTGRGNNVVAAGTSPPTVGTTGGRFGGFLQVNGAGSYATWGDRPDFRFAAGQDYSFTLWFRVSELPASDPALISNKDWNSGKNTGFVFGPGQPGTGTNANGLGFNTGDAVDRADVNALSYSPGQWVFAAVTVRRGGTATVYCGGSDGLLRSISTHVQGVDSQISGLPLNIGQDGTGTYSAAYAGGIDDLGAWRRALSPSEVQGIYQRGLAGLPLASSWLPPSGGLTTGLALSLKADGTLTNAVGGTIAPSVFTGTPRYTTGKVGQAFRFQNDGNPAAGPSDWAVSLGVLDATYAGDFSVSLWERTTSALDAALWGNKDWDSGGNVGWVVSTLPERNVNWNGPGGTRRDVNVPGFSDGSWHHLVVTFSRSTGQVTTYRDGALLTLKDLSPSATASLATGYPTLLGSSGPGTWAGSADLDEVALWTRLLSPAEAAEVYSRGQAGIPLVP